MKKLPTDIQLIETIFEQYYDEFTAYDEKENKTRSSKMYVPIDIFALAERFGVDEDIVFGRLYYHLDKKYGYQDENGVKVPFFTIRSGSDRHCVHFAYLASILATMKSESRKFWIATSISILALAISLISLIAR